MSRPTPPTAGRPRALQRAYPTKLAAPRSEGALVRLRLHRQIDRAAQHGAVWIPGGPGTGKSTLAATWAAGRPGKTLWYRADDGDADPATTFATLGELARTQRRARTLPPYHPRDLDRLDRFALAYFRAFFAVVPAASKLVVDDAHAPTGEAFAVLLDAMVRELPGDVTLVVLSRHDPDGLLLDQVARGGLQVLDAAGLSFDDEEAARLLAGRVDATLAHRLRSRAQGWAAGILLLAQTEDGTSLHGGALADYFEQRVLVSFDSQTERVLAAASLLPEVDRPALERMGMGAEAVVVLEALRQRHSFVARLARAGASWRLHDLLRDALRARFDQIGDAGFRKTLLRAAASLAEERHLARDAVQLHRRAGDEDGALRSAEAFARALVRSHRLDEWDAVAATLDPARAEASAVVQFASGEAAWARNDSRAAIARFGRAFALLPATAPSPQALLIAASALGALLEGWQDFDGLSTWVSRLREQLPARAAIGDAADAMRIDATCVRAMDMVSESSLGDYDALLERLLQMLARPPDGLPADEAVVASGVLMEAAGYGRTDRELFRRVVEATAPWLERADLAPLIKAGWLNVYGMLGRHWPLSVPKLPAPLRCIELAVGLAQEHGGQATAYTALHYLTLAAVAGNDPEAARRWLAGLRDTADPRHVRQTADRLDAEACVHALSGEWELAEEAIDRSLELARLHRFPESVQWNPLLTRCRIGIARGRTNEARTALLAAAPGCPPGMRRDFTLILADVATAAEALRARGAIPPGQVESIMHAAARHDWRGFGGLLAPLAARLCADALRLGIEPAFARRTVRERNLPAPSRFDPDWPWPIRIHALGGMRIVIDDMPLAPGPRVARKPLDLLKAVIAYGPAPLDAAVVLDALWPDADGAAARSAFDMTLMRLRKVLGHDEALRLDAGHLSFDPACVWVDAHAYAAGAIDAYPGPLFGSDALESWWAPARERLHQRFLRRALERGTGLERQGDIEEALAIYEAGIAQDPLAEDLYQGAIRCHLAAGRAGDALRVFRRCRDQLSIVLSVSPSPATARLVAGLAAS